MSGQATDTKNRILKAARTLYSVHGFDNTKLDDILVAGGISKGAFYHYFKSKDGLCAELLDEVIGDYHNLTESLNTDIEPIDRLRQIIDKLAGLNSSGQWVNCRLILRLSNESLESYPDIERKIQTFWQWYSGFFAGLIDDCRTSGQISTRMSAETQLRLVMSLLAGAVTMDNMGLEHGSFADLADIVIAALQS